MATGKLEEVAVVGLPDPVSGAVIGLIAIPKDGIEAGDALRADLSQAVVAGMGRSYRPRESISCPTCPGAAV